MLLRDKLVNIGGVFFKHRSSIPLLLVGLIILKRRDFFYFDSVYFGEFAFKSLCFLVSFFGFLIRAYTVGHSRFGTSGRNTREQLADSLNKDGIYSITRNPLYLGNFFITLGIVLFSQSWEAVMISVFLFVIFYVPIILAEESFLLDKFKGAFVEYARRTPAVLPDFRLWKGPGLKFNLSRFLSREHDSFFGIVWWFFFIGMLKDYTLAGRVCFAPVWVAVFTVSFISWLVFKKSKKYLKSVDKGE